MLRKKTVRLGKTGSIACQQEVLHVSRKYCMSARNTSELIEKQDVKANFTTSDTSNNAENQT